MKISLHRRDCQEAEESPCESFGGSAFPELALCSSPAVGDAQDLSVMRWNFQPTARQSFTVDKQGKIRVSESHLPGGSYKQEPREQNLIRLL